MDSNKKLYEVLRFVLQLIIYIPFYYTLARFTNIGLLVLLLISCVVGLISAYFFAIIERYFYEQRTKTKSKGAYEK